MTPTGRSWQDDAWLAFDDIGPALVGTAYPPPGADDDDPDLEPEEG